MSDFVSGFWNIYVAGLTAVSILACAWLLYANTVKRTGGPVELHGHVWDENLQEYNHPLPRWWMWLFYITIVFALVYLAVYPGFGSFQGGFGWSSVGQYEKEMQKAEAQYAPIFNKYLKMDLKAVAADPDAKQMGERMFLTYCSVCHGSEARGAKGFPNLTDNDWLVRRRTGTDSNVNPGWPQRHHAAVRTGSRHGGRQGRRELRSFAIGFGRRQRSRAAR